MLGAIILKTKTQRYFTKENNHMKTKLQGLEEPHFLIN